MNWELALSPVCPSQTLAYLALASASFLLLLRMYVPSTHLNHVHLYGRRAHTRPGDSIAIWNYKKTVVGIAICLWVTNVAFLLQGKSLPLLPTIRNPRQTCVSRYNKGELSIFD